LPFSASEWARFSPTGKWHQIGRRLTEYEYLKCADYDGDRNEVAKAVERITSQSKE
jgi:hypothetical protein